MASIRKRLLGTYLGVFAGLSLGLLLLILYTFNEREERWRDDLGARMASFSIQVASGTDPTAIGTALDALDPEKAYTVAILESQEHVLFSRGPGQAQVNHARVVSCVQAPHAESSRGCRLIRQGHLTAVVFSPELPSDSANSALIRRSLALGLFLLWAATWTILVVSYRISAPLKRLAEQAEQLFRMVDDSPIDVPPTDDEVEALARVLEASRLQLRSQVFVDALTGLYNRRYVLRQVGAEFERCARERKISLVMVIDLDHFKAVNDTYGHEAGDRVLVSVSQVIKKVLRPSDLVARFGGEEFVVVLPMVSPAEGGVVASRLLKAVAASSVALDGGGTVTVTISIGLASCAFPEGKPVDAQEVFQRLFKLADHALYQAKHEGRNRYVEVPTSEFAALSAPAG